MIPVTLTVSAELFSTPVSFSKASFDAPVGGEEGGGGVVK